MSRILIVDGYNLLLGAARYATDAARDLDTARDRLIADLGARAAEGERVIVVFDGASNPMSDGEPRSVGGITVIFSPSGTDADTVIESLAAAARGSGETAEIVTSDAATRWTAAGANVTVTRAAAFSRELDDDERDWREKRSEAGRGRVTVSDRLSARVRTRLDGMSGRRGGDVE